MDNPPHGRPTPPVPAESPKRHQVDGRDLVCLICKGDRFWSKRLLMNTRGAAYLGWDWANRDALAVVCAECGHILWFAD